MTRQRDSSSTVEGGGAVARLTLVCAVLALLLAPLPAGAQARAPSQTATAAADAAAAAEAAYEKTPQVRRMRLQRYAQAGGIDPCMTPDPGFGIYDRWSRAPTLGQMIAPQRGGLTRSGGFDLLIHFHGHYPIRKEFVKEARGIVLVAIDLGIGSGPYASAFASPRAFTRLIASVEAEMARRTGRQRAHVRKLALSAWSAGYGAIAQILRQKAGQQVDAVILLDSVHTSYADGSKQLRTSGLEPFVQFAKQAARGRRLMFQSYSSIIPPGYASTREVAHHVIRQIGGKPLNHKASGVLGLQQLERYDRQGYHARGYRGQDKPDHCAHLGLMTTVLKRYLKPRWRSPRGRRGPAEVSQELRLARAEGRVHVVERGQALSTIAHRHGTTVRELRTVNGLAKGKPIHPGDELIIPKSKSKSKSKAKGNKPGRQGTGRRARGADSVHVVERGQSLSTIAHRHGVTVRALRSANGLVKGKPIHPGDELVIPAGGKSNGSQAKRSQRDKKQHRRQPPGAKIHVVAAGQSLRSIARRYRITVDALREANDMAPNESLIRPGDELVIPADK